MSSWRSSLVIGTPDTCIRQIRRLQEAMGISHFNCSFWFGDLDQKQVLRSMALFAREGDAGVPLMSGTRPGVDGRARVAGVRAPVEIVRDPDGIPHVRARSAPDAFFGQGWAHAQDRLFQMEYDRRRAYGRWAEWVGPAGVDGDRLMRRFRVEDSVRRDWDAASSETREMLAAFASGVNAFVESTTRWGVEFDIASARPAPWRPWDSMAVFKVRHLDMGPWRSKLWRARLLRHLGPERTAQLTRAPQAHPMLIVPPGAEYRGPAQDGSVEMERHLSAMALVPPGSPGTATAGAVVAPQGSNSWAVSGSRTASGKPLVAGDPHRTLDVPNVYYQNHIACPEWDAIGLSFPGVPGLPHFGHNARVAWCVTHAMADYQDLYIERFDGGDPYRYEFRGAWRSADVRVETILVRGADPVEIETVETHHGPVVAGNPRHGHAIACAYTAIAGINSTFEAFVPMLAARNADEVEATMRSWVEPANNFVFADVDGVIGYRARGQVPVRPMANAWVPVPDGPASTNGVAAFPSRRCPRSAIPIPGSSPRPTARSPAPTTHITSGSSTRRTSGRAGSSPGSTRSRRPPPPTWLRSTPTECACRRAISFAWSSGLAPATRRDRIAAMRAGRRPCGVSGAGTVSWTRTPSPPRSTRRSASDSSAIS